MTDTAFSNNWFIIVQNYSPNWDGNISLPSKTENTYVNGNRKSITYLKYRYRLSSVIETT